MTFMFFYHATHVRAILYLKYASSLLRFSSDLIVATIWRETILW